MDGNNTVNDSSEPRTKKWSVAQKIGCAIVCIALQQTCAYFACYLPRERKKAELEAIEAAKTPEQRAAEQAQREAEQAEQSQRGKLKQYIEELADTLLNQMNSCGDNYSSYLQKMYNCNTILAESKNAMNTIKKNKDEFNKEFKTETKLVVEVRRLYRHAFDYLEIAGQVAQYHVNYFNESDRGRENKAREYYDKASETEKTLQPEMREFLEARYVLLRILDEPGAMDLLSQEWPTEVKVNDEMLIVDPKTGEPLYSYRDKYVKEFRKQ